MPEKKTQIMDEGAVKRTLMRMSHQIVERNPDADEICVIGVRSRGVPLARILAENVQEISGKKVQIGELDVAPCRDDRDENSEQPTVTATNVPFSVKDRVVVLVDDVLYTGRTVRAAIEALIRLGRPACIQLAVLVDRGHRELPIRGDYVGKNVPTSRKERISVKVPEFDGETAVELINYF